MASRPSCRGPSKAATNNWELLGRSTALCFLVVGQICRFCGHRIVVEVTATTAPRALTRVTVLTMPMASPLRLGQPVTQRFITFQACTTPTQVCAYTHAVYMHTCRYTRIHICTLVCMNSVCMYTCLHVRIYARVHVPQARGRFAKVSDFDCWLLG